MKIRAVWKEKMKFIGDSVREDSQIEANQPDPFVVTMDAKAPIGSGQGLTPKELVALGVAGCTAMDVAALMKKYAQPVETFQVTAEFTLTKGTTPAIFQTMDLVFDLTGNIDQSKALEAVRLSQTKYCGVSAMISKSVPINYIVRINNADVGSGTADFK